ncbi:citrate lyase subunit beta/citryl-CoA lyase [Clostridium tetanomorphum]|uniref:HpcH/HpaI aldolase/citrate lyase family protein n=1 Tax=Clostridium tetanomorphum TaxID=1553 RepID=UPI000445B956|nr:aldolase/citrate lyase family protein [Clostridium tetanomorphum]KAJ52270.1 citrate lyase beta chain [Clostridium tetanomorphum DSM 665]MBP1863725.1 citrate lyase subunit beta/citryl-CoA lyase [Clostridium tetanomorphum]NRS86301.1 citrate lyase subunit beta/citryl-CoA lyase [Clostridium tetanomorphum]SQC00691.1 citrate lyase beta chain [Clostridium tetanomorphum]
MKTLRRTMLFMPGNNPGMLQNAPILGADAVILDLEDAVSLTEKDAARALVSGAIKTLDYSGVELVVRVNPLDTEFGHKDLETIARVKPDTILLPKATREQLQESDAIITKVEEEEGFEKGSINLFGLIETAYGLETVYEAATATKRLVGLLLGAEDLTSDFGIKRTKESNEIFYARNRFAAACRAARIDAIDTPFTDTNDYEGLRLDTEKAKSLGFTGKASINPRQIDTIHSVYNPTEAEIKHAVRVLEARDEAFAKGLGVFSLDGKMIDAPVINRAITTVELAKRLGLLK